MNIARLITLAAVAAATAGPVATAEAGRTSRGGHVAIGFKHHGHSKSSFRHHGVSRFGHRSFGRSHVSSKRFGSFGRHGLSAHQRHGLTRHAPPSHRSFHHSKRKFSHGSSLFGGHGSGVTIHLGSSGVKSYRNHAVSPGVVVVSPKRHVSSTRFIGRDFDKYDHRDGKVVLRDDHRSHVRSSRGKTFSSAGADIVFSNNGFVPSSKAEDDLRNKLQDIRAERKKKTATKKLEVARTLPTDRFGRVVTNDRFVRTTPTVVNKTETLQRDRFGRYVSRSQPTKTVVAHNTTVSRAISPFANRTVTQQKTSDRAIGVQRARTVTVLRDRFGRPIEKVETTVKRVEPAKRSGFTRIGSTIAKTGATDRDRFGLKRDD